MKQRRLGEILKLKASKKWAAFEDLAVARDICLAPISIKSESDAADVAHLAKLITSEQKKAKYDHVLTLIKCVRWSLVDNEAAFQVLVQGNLANNILAAISGLREAKASTRMGGYQCLASLLVNISDMFEWEFFGDGDYPRFIEEVLLIFTRCSDYDQSLFVEAATVMMAMCSVKISVVLDCLVSTPSCVDMLARAVRDIPRAKSFYYEALLLEIVYRMYRHSKKDGDEQKTCAMDKVIHSLPNEVAQAVTSIRPKAFRDETRALLNAFNEQVGLIRSFRLSKFRCCGFGLLKGKLSIDPAGWLDVGGTAIEIEAEVKFGDQTLTSTIKIPFESISAAQPKGIPGEILLTLNKSVCLDELIESINDRRLARANCLDLYICVDDKVSTLVLELVNHHLGVKAPVSVIEMVTAVGLVEVAKFSPSKESDSAPNKGVATSAISDKKSRTVKTAVSSESKQSTRKRVRDMNTFGKALGGFPSPEKDLEHTSLAEHVNVRQVEKIADGGIEVVNQAHDYSLSVTVNPALTSSSSKPCPAMASVILDEHVAEVNRGEQEISSGDDDATQDDPVAQRHTFRTLQSKQTTQMRAIVEDIAKTNAQYRQFLAVQLSNMITVPFSTRLAQKRQEEKIHNYFDDLETSLSDKGTLRSARMNHRLGLQRAASSGISSASPPTMQVSATSEKVLKGAQDGTTSDLRDALDRVQKKLRTQATQTVVKAKRKLLEIENSFNTEDLHAVQQVLQRN